jgi:hypothetical protein
VSRQHLFFYFYLSLFPPGKLCLALHSSISTLQAYFLLILSLIFFISICFVLIHFSNLLFLFQLHPLLIFFIYQIWSSFFWFNFLFC